MRVAQFLSANDSLHVHGSGGLSQSVTAYVTRYTGRDGERATISITAFVLYTV